MLDDGGRSFHIFYMACHHPQAALEAATRRAVLENCQIELVRVHKFEWFEKSIRDVAVLVAWGRAGVRGVVEHSGPC